MDSIPCFDSVVGLDRLDNLRASLSGEARDSSEVMGVRFPPEQLYLPFWSPGDGNASLSPVWGVAAAVQGTVLCAVLHVDGLS